MKWIRNSFIVLVASFSINFTAIAQDCFPVNSSFIEKACYSSETQRLELILNGRSYNYCGVSKATFDSFLSASSKGSYYNQYIKGRFRC